MEGQRRHQTNKDGREDTAYEVKGQDRGEDTRDSGERANVNDDIVPDREVVGWLEEIGVHGGR